MSRFIRDKVNQVCSVEQAWVAAFGTSPPLGKCFCPFHDNVHTPAAKVYENRLVCFGYCNRSYASYDILKSFAPEFLNRLLSHQVLSPTPPAPQVKASRFESTDLRSLLIEYYGR